MQRYLLPLIVELRECSQAWYTMSKTSIFREACSESQPALFGLVGWDILAEALWTTFYDVKSQEWLLASYNTLEPEMEYEDPGAYRNSLYACDGGLVWFVPISCGGQYLTSLPILVCNPLTSTWKALPLTPVEDFEKRKIVMVHLVVEVDRNMYSVILVSRENIGTAFSAHFYSSETGIWSTMDSGLVYGAGCCYLWDAGHPGAPYVFDYTTKTLFGLKRSASLASVGVLWYSLVKDHLFVLHESNVRGQCDGYMYLVSEYVWESSDSNLIMSLRARSRSSGQITNICSLQAPVSFYYLQIIARSGMKITTSLSACTAWLQINGKYLRRCHTVVVSIMSSLIHPSRFSSGGI